MSRIFVLSGGCTVWMFASAAFGIVGDPQIMTDHPVYRGELSCSTLDRTIAEAYRIFGERYGRAPGSDTEKVIALWIWMGEHYMHACDNKVFVGTDNPDARQGKDPPWLGHDGWMDNKDCLMNQFSFSFALCYSVHAHLSALIGYALGNDFSRVRCPEITGHTPFEAFADGRWILADCTMGITMFDDDGKPIGLKEVYDHKDAGDKEWFASPKRGGPYKFHMSPFGDDNAGYSRVRWYQYNFGYNAMPIAYALRAGESFTRYLDPGLEDGQTWMFWGRDYWPLNGKPKHGPYRNVTFLDDPPMGNNRKGRGLAYYGNGVFEYVPPLTAGKYKQSMTDSKDVTFADGALRGKKADAHVTFEHVSPYVIAARPVEGGDRDWNVIKEKCRDGAIVSGMAVGQVPVTVSVDGGGTWQPVGQASGDFTIDFTDLVKGRHEYLVRFGLSKTTGLKGVRMRTVVQVGRGVFPRLKDGGTTVTYQASGQAPIHGGPSQYLAERLRRKDLETAGVRVYQVKAPGPIRHAAGVARVEDAGRGPWSVEFSLDGGKTWRAGVKDVMTGGQGDKQWDGGKAGYVWAQMNFPDNKKAKDVLIRFAKGNILHGQVFATYETSNTSRLTVTYGWTEDGRKKEDSHTIAAGKATDTWTVPTGEKVKTKWVRFEAE
jgi:hypothetical protein